LAGRAQEPAVSLALGRAGPRAWPLSDPLAVSRGAAPAPLQVCLLTGAPAQATTLTKSVRSRATCRSAAASCLVGAQPAPARWRVRQSHGLCHILSWSLRSGVLCGCRDCKVDKDAPHHHRAAQLRALHQEVCEARLHAPPASAPHPNAPSPGGSHATAAAPLQVREAPRQHPGARLALLPRQRGRHRRHRPVPVRRGACRPRACRPGYGRFC